MNYAAKNFSASQEGRILALSRYVSMTLTHTNTTPERGAHRAYPVDCRGDALRLGWELWSRRGLRVLLPAAILRQFAPRCHFFGYGLSVSLAASDSRDVRSFTYVQPSGASLGRSRFEASRLGPLSPGLRTRPLPAMHAWVGTPEHHSLPFVVLHQQSWPGHT